MWQVHLDTSTGGEGGGLRSLSGQGSALEINIGQTKASHMRGWRLPKPTAGQRKDSE